MRYFYVRQDGHRTDLTRDTTVSIVLNVSFGFAPNGLFQKEGFEVMGMAVVRE